MAKRQSWVVVALGLICLTSLLLLVLKLSRGGGGNSCPSLREREDALQAREARLATREADLEKRIAAASSSTECPPTAVEVASSPVVGGDIGFRKPKIPCPSSTNEPCSGFGQCDFEMGSCVCKAGHGGKDCHVKLPFENMAWDGQDDAMQALHDAKAMHSLLTIVVMRRPHDDARVTRISAMAKKLAVHVTMMPPSQAEWFTTLDTLASTLSGVSTPFTLLLSPDAELNSESNLDTLVSLLLTTDVDVLGFMQRVREPLHKRHLGLASDDAVIMDGTSHLLPMCHQIRHSHWQVRHHQAPFGYLRHERYVAYCDRTSNSIAFRTDLLSNLWSHATHTSGTVAGDAWRWERQQLLEPKMASMMFADLFVGIASHNRQVQGQSANVTALKGLVKDPALRHALWTLSQLAPTRLPGSVLVGTCAECIVDVVNLDEKLNSEFAEKHQVEFYVDTRNRPSNPVCVKSGGIYGHSNRVLSKAWLDPKFAPLPKVKGHDHVYGVSLHHGNLFGALRLQEELLWETDGDIDFIAFNATHDEMMQRWQALVQRMEAEHGFQTKVTYPEKPWYVAFTRDKTDFQCNARSPLDPNTRGKPPQQHTTTVDYQGRRAFMNGFVNPWRGIRSDPGHDYRTKYLAQQGWVPQFTKKSISCGVPGHNACLPDCNLWYRQLDHNWCSDAALSTDRDPGLRYEFGGAEPDMSVFAGEKTLWERRHNWRYL